MGWDWMVIIGHRYSKITFGANKSNVEKGKGAAAGVRVCLTRCLIGGHCGPMMDFPRSPFFLPPADDNCSWNFEFLMKHRNMLFCSAKISTQIKDVRCGTLWCCSVWYCVVWSCWLISLKVPAVVCSWSVWNCTPTPIRGGGCCSKIWTTSLFSPGVRYSTDPNWSDTNMGHWTSQCYDWTLFLKGGIDRF